jgi:hypothetical protein
LSIDIKSLARGLTTGYKRKGAASRVGKAKKMNKIYTIGLPTYFSRFLFTGRTTRKFPARIIISQEEKKIKHKKKMIKSKKIASKQTQKNKNKKK